MRSSTTHTLTFSQSAERIKMGFISRQLVNYYKSTVYKRRDDDGSLFCFKAADFPGLISEDYSFVTKRGHKLGGHFYHYGSPKPNRLIVFEHGMSVGHRAYFREIERIAREGYLVYSYDHTGCTESEGEHIMGLSGSLADLDSCISALAERGFAPEQISVIGHSWGGYSTMNILSYHPNLRSIVALSGFISLRDMLGQVIPGILAPFRPVIYRLEKETNPDYAESSGIATLLSAKSPALIIHSEGDNSVNIKRHFVKLQNALSDKENVTFLKFTDRVHNPTYTPDAVKYKQTFFKEYTKRTKKNKHKSNMEEHKAFLASYDWQRMTAQDEEVWKVIFNFLKK